MDIQKLKDLNFDITKYSLEDLLQLFRLKTLHLDREILSECKMQVLKMHPDKSKLDAKYFVFYSNAYNKLFELWRFQHRDHDDDESDKDGKDDKVVRKTDANFKPLKRRKNVRLGNDDDDYKDADNDEEKKRLLDLYLSQFYENEDKTYNAKKFNDWFNQQFEKFAIGEKEKGDNNDNDNDNDNDGEHDDDDIIVTKSEDISSVSETRPLTFEELRHERSLTIQPLSKDESERQLATKETRLQNEGLQRAFSLQRQTDRAVAQNQLFWKELKLLL